MQKYDLIFQTLITVVNYKYYYLMLVILYENKNQSSYISIKAHSHISHVSKIEATNWTRFHRESEVCKSESELKTEHIVPYWQ